MIRACCNCQQQVQICLRIVLPFQILSKSDELTMHNYHKEPMSIHSMALLSLVSMVACMVPPWSLQLACPVPLPLPGFRHSFHVSASVSAHRDAPRARKRELKKAELGRHPQDAEIFQKSARHMAVVKFVAPFWVLSIIRHPVFRGPKKGPP